jgi:hypothetical protein
MPGHEGLNWDLSPVERKAQAERMRWARKLAGLTMEQAARLTGVTVTSIKQWEGGSLPTMPGLRPRIAAVYGVAEAVLFAELEEQMARGWRMVRPGVKPDPLRYVTCRHCGHPLLVDSPKATRLAYHAQCRRDHDRERQAAGRVRVKHDICCAHCGTMFEAKRADARYCSDRCRSAAARARVTDSCPDR